MTVRTGYWARLQWHVGTLQCGRCSAVQCSGRPRPRFTGRDNWSLSGRGGQWSARLDRAELTDRLPLAWCWIARLTDMQKTHTHTLSCCAARSGTVNIHHSIDHIYSDTTCLPAYLYPTCLSATGTLLPYLLTVLLNIAELSYHVYQQRCRA